MEMIKKKKCEECEMNYKGCDCYLEYVNVKSDLMV